MGHKAGDNAQVLGLAEALGWPFEVKRFVYRKTELLTNLLAGWTLAGIVRRKSSPLEPPWPELIISAGRRNEPVCRWIQARAPHPVRLVHVGRPWARIERFDLVITTPQYRLPQRPNVLHNQTPLHRVTEARLAAEAARWAPRLAHLPRPWIAVVVGGNAGPYAFDAAAAGRLGRAASALAGTGSLLVTTSARTLGAAATALAAAINRPMHFYRWTTEAADNPYFAFLALADSLVVTGESMSMLAEACATRKPVYVFDFGKAGPYAMRPAAPDDQRIKKAGWRSRSLYHLGAWCYSLMMHAGPRRLTRDIRLIHRLLIESGRAVWIGERFPEIQPPPLQDIPRAVARVQALFEPDTVRTSLRQALRDPLIDSPEGWR